MSYSDVGVTAAGKATGTARACMSATESAHYDSKGVLLCVPDVETLPNPCFWEEGPFSLLRSMNI